MTLQKCPEIITALGLQVPKNHLRVTQEMLWHRLWLTAHKQSSLGCRGLSAAVLGFGTYEVGLAAQ